MNGVSQYKLVDFRDLLEQPSASAREKHAFEQSWDQPDVFWGEVWTNSGSLRSRFQRSYDFFADALERHSSGQNVAFRWFDASNQQQELTYRQIWMDASRYAAEWAAAGVQPHAKACLVFHFGSEFVVHLFAAMKLGLQVVWLPPHGRTYVANRLESVSPDVIFTADSHRIPETFHELVVSHIGDGELTAVESTPYPAGSVAVSVFDPVSEDPLAPVDISADCLFLNGLRDSQIYLDLLPGKQFSMAGFDPTQVQPAALFASMLAGATYVQVDREAWQRLKNDISPFDCDVLGVSCSFRDHLIDNEAELSRCRFWFRNLLEEGEEDIWHQFSARQIRDGRTCGPALMTAGHGGFSLYGRKLPSYRTPHVLPVPGTPWEFESPYASDLETVSALGILTQSHPATSTTMAPCIMLYQQQSNWVFAAITPRRRHGITVSSQEIQDTVCKQLGFEQAVVLQLDKGWGNAIAVHLLLFDLTDRAAEMVSPEESAMQCVEREIGRMQRPDIVEFFPFTPVENGVDQIESYYLTGVLRRKKECAFFGQLKEVREKLVGFEPELAQTDEGVESG